MSDRLGAVLRVTLGCLLLASFASAGPRSARAFDVPEGTVRWAIWREGEKVGRHTMVIHHAGDKIVVDNEMDIAVRRVNLFVVHRFVLREKETWVDGKLSELDAFATNDGEAASVGVGRTPAGLVVDGDGTHFAAPSGLVPSTLWHIDMTKSDSVLDVGTGNMLSVRFAMGAEAPLPVNGKDVPARHVSMSGDAVRELWYGPDGILVRAQFAGPDGIPLDYRIEPR